MSVSRGARRLFQLIHRFIHRYGEFYAGQSWIATHLRASVRSVKRWTAVLIRHGYLAVTRRGNQTSTYQILKNLAPQLAPQLAPPLKDNPSGITPSERKPSASSQTASAELPEETITSPGGRTYLNPEWQACRDAVHASREEIYRARDPKAYQNAIIRRVRGEWNAAKTA